MIYEVYIDDKLLYYPNDETYVILNSRLTLALNEAGSFEFDVPNYNLRYDDFKLRQSMVQVKKDGEEIFYGEVREVKTNSDFTKHVYVVGELAFLFDSIQPQARYLTTPLDAMNKLIAQHNSQVEDRKKYVLSEVTATDNDDQIYFYTNGEDTLSIIREKICDVLDGYIHVTKSNNIRYISVVNLDEFGTCTQEIQFGENLLDYSCNISASDIATCVVPRGVKLKEESRTEYAVEGLDEYLTIKGTSIDDYHKKEADDFVQIEEAVTTFGYVRVLKNWDNVTDAENLKKKAIEWLKSAQYSSMTLELRAMDMSQLDINIDSFNLGEEVRVWAPPYGMDTRKQVRKKTIYLQDLEKNEVVIGNTVRQSFTSQSSKVVEQLKEEIPEVSSLLEGAKHNALELLTDPTKGYVSYVFDEAGNRTEIWIADALEHSKISKKWVWNSSGLGYMKKLPDGTWETNVAITMDGRISADFVTTGTMSGDLVRGGTFKAGGLGYGKSGSIEVYNADSTQKLITLDENGLDMDAGSITLGENFSVDIYGNMVASNAVINGEINADMGYISGWEITPYGLEKYYKDDKRVRFGWNQPEGESYVIRAGYSYSNDWDVNFNLDWKGKLTARDAEIEGEITSKKGNIAGWEITEYGLIKEFDDTHRMSIGWDNSYYDSYAINAEVKQGDYWVSPFNLDWNGKLVCNNAEIIGNIQSGSTITCGNNFSVDVNGNMSASNADITGKITSSEGTIGGFTIGYNNLHVGDASSGIWIFGGDVQGSPKGSVVVGTHGAGLIRLGYKHGDKIGILWEANNSERYFVDLMSIGKKI